MKLGVVTLWTNGRQDEELAPRRLSSRPPRADKSAKPANDVLASDAHPLFVVPDALLPDDVTPVAPAVASIPAPADTLVTLAPRAPKTRRGTRSRSRSRSA